MLRHTITAILESHQSEYSKYDTSKNQTVCRSSVFRRFRLRTVHRVTARHGWPDAGYDVNRLNNAYKTSLSGGKENRQRHRPE